MLDFLGLLDLVQFGLLCSDADFAAYCPTLAQLAAARGLDAHVHGGLSSAAPESSPTVASQLSAALDDFQTHSIKIIVVIAPLQVARVAAAALFARGMYGANFVFIVDQQLQTPALTNERAGYAVFTSAVALQLATQRDALTSEKQFLMDYSTAYGASTDGSPGFFGRFAYDGVLTAVYALRALRARCVVSITPALLMSEMRLVNFTGASGAVRFGGWPAGTAGLENNRVVPPNLFRITNLGIESLRFAQV